MRHFIFINGVQAHPKISLEERQGSLKTGSFNMIQFLKQYEVDHACIMFTGKRKGESSSAYSFPAYCFAPELSLKALLQKSTILVLGSENESALNRGSNRHITLLCSFDF